MCIMVDGFNSKCAKINRLIMMCLLQRWFLYPPDQTPEFQPNHTTLSWVSLSYPNLELHQMPVECTIRPGEVMLTNSAFICLASLKVLKAGISCNL